MKDDRDFNSYTCPACGREITLMGHEPSDPCPAKKKTFPGGVGPATPASAEVRRIADKATDHALADLGQMTGARIRLGHAMALLEAHVATVRSHIEADLATQDIRQNLILATAAVVEQLTVVDTLRRAGEVKKSGTEPAKK